MTLFWIIAAGLTLLAMAFVILPLLRGFKNTGISSDELNLEVFQQQLEELDNDLDSGILDQARYDAARKDLEKELLIDVSGDKVAPAAMNRSSGRWAMGTAVLIPVSAVILYQILGTPEIIPRLTGQVPDTTVNSAQEQAKNLPPMEELVQKLADKLVEQPENIDGWLMLARSYMSMSRVEEGLEAYGQAMRLAPENTAVLLAYAEGLAKTDSNNFTGKAASLVEKAVKLDADNPNARWMMGIVSYQRGNYLAAVEHWERAQTLLGPNNKDASTITNALEDARREMGKTPKLPSIVQQAAAKSVPTANAAGKSKITLEVVLSDEMRAKAKPGDLVFIYAKALEGPQMPLAAARKQVRDLPLTIELDDGMAMMPQFKLSNFPEVVVGARISLSGNPIAKSGDPEGEVKPVTPGQTGTVKVVINGLHP
ncbi:MAG: cytochrome C heme lyase [Gammaproteobacteria bacterium (ex Lamellibrachia satsuma)]|nr:MAG: c-type cytochrome biogenesis protein CcmI [Gammaproteobacteria bacterium (ex Lamellibrachia satsuma)]RRS35948.1 MAG: cytochrome C heme lyase [Gammaproteobacteria bacterium (ex Lamellibrachia satsuma)]RRS36540.1 MAG: cytochrome C heme lyase [Gammaproteobacteria bacterium (ex Lamellibrachia satsuma)]